MKMKTHKKILKHFVFFLFQVIETKNRLMNIVKQCLGLLFHSTQVLCLRYFLISYILKLIDVLLEIFFEGIPTLIILSSGGKVITRRGHDDVSSKGVEASKARAKGKKLPASSPDDYKW
jgi:hypothetical protein